LSLTYSSRGPGNTDMSSDCDSSPLRPASTVLGCPRSSCSAPARRAANHDDRLRKESPCHEGERLQRTRVDPLRIIDDHNVGRSLLAAPSSVRTARLTSSRSGGLRPSVRAIPPKPSAAAQEVELRKPTRSTQLLHPCVWKLHLQFGTTDVENAKIRGRRGHMGQQRRLAYPRLPADDEHAALT